MVLGRSDRRRTPAPGVADLLPWPKVDFAKFGRSKPSCLVAHQKISGEPGAQLGDDSARHLSRRRDITELEAFRKTMKSARNGEKSGS